MSKWTFVAGATWIVGSACIVSDEPMGYASCEETRRECQVAYSSFSGYYRACNSVVSPCSERSTSSSRGGAGGAAGAGASGGGDTSQPTPPMSPSELAEATSEEPRSTNVGAAPLPDRTRYSAFDIPCERDSQCGPGKCLDGDCYYGCSSDEQCGSGDRCATESGTRICWPDPNPPVVCTRSAQCEEGFTCLNGSCRQSCTVTDQCDNLLDRCASDICLPDRRPLSECVLNSECAEGLVCLDGACVAACPAPAKDGVCLAEPIVGQPGGTPAEGEEPPVGEPSEPEESTGDAGAAAPINSIQ
jgi:hypothetical protein